jgi:hypothetical protein
LIGVSSHLTLCVCRHLAGGALGPATCSAGTSRTPSVQHCPKRGRAGQRVAGLHGSVAAFNRSQHEHRLSGRQRAVAPRDAVVLSAVVGDIALACVRDDPLPDGMIDAHFTICGATRNLDGCTTPYHEIRHALIVRLHCCFFASVTIHCDTNTFWAVALLTPSPAAAVEAGVALGKLFDDCAFERKDDLILLTNIAVVSVVHSIQVRMGATQRSTGAWIRHHCS